MLGEKMGFLQFSLFKKLGHSITIECDHFWGIIFSLALGFMSLAASLVGGSVLGKALGFGAHWCCRSHALQAWLTTKCCPCSPLPHPWATFTCTGGYPCVLWHQWKFSCLPDVTPNLHPQPSCSQSVLWHFCYGVKAQHSSPACLSIKLGVHISLSTSLILHIFPHISYTALSVLIDSMYWL